MREYEIAELIVNAKSLIIFYPSFYGILEDEDLKDVDEIIEQYLADQYLNKGVYPMKYPEPSLQLDDFIMAQKEYEKIRRARVRLYG